MSKKKSKALNWSSKGAGTLSQIQPAARACAGTREIFKQSRADKISVFPCIFGKIKSSSRFLEELFEFSRAYFRKKKPALPKSKLTRRAGFWYNGCSGKGCRPDHEYMSMRVKLTYPPVLL